MTSSWPPRWEGSNFKRPGSQKVARGLKREARLSRENKHKAEVRFRDKYCRFPLCGCKRFQLATNPTEVSHARHKGMGGNPGEDRSDAPDMLLLCSARHKENIFSVDRKTIRWRPLTPAGADGPIAWEIHVRTLRRLVDKPLLELATVEFRGDWFELARETSRHVYEPQTPAQAVILAWLRSMEK